VVNQATDMDYDKRSDHIDLQADLSAYPQAVQWFSTEHRTMLAEYIADRAISNPERDQDLNRRPAEVLLQCKDIPEEAKALLRGAIPTEPFDTTIVPTPAIGPAPHVATDAYLDSTESIGSPLNPTVKRKPASTGNHRSRGMSM